MPLLPDRFRPTESRSRWLMTLAAALAIVAAELPAAGDGKRIATGLAVLMVVLFLRALD